SGSALGQTNDPIVSLAHRAVIEKGDLHGRLKTRFRGFGGDPCKLVNAIRRQRFLCQPQMLRHVTLK
ncbi:hypothetical protein OS493_023418, partial [Desmophyllum pertusum]